MCCPSGLLRLVLEVIAGVKGLTDAEALAEQVYGNTAAMFFPDKAVLGAPSGDVA